MEDLFEQGIEQFIRYQKETENKKTRQQKKRQKVQRLTADLKDPQQRRIRHQLRRKQQKAKLQKQIGGMSQEQARIYLDNKKQVKRLAKQRNIKALETGMPILIDAIYQDRMNQKQNKSLAIQIQLIMKSIKHLQDPPGIHLCSVAGFLKIQLQKMKYHYWTLTSSPDNIIQVAKKLNKNPVYLSPDSNDQLVQIDPNAAYIIGGLVDRTVIKNASLNRAAQLGIPTKRLPIRQYMAGRKCLNLDHVVMMMCKFKQTGDWKTAFDFGAPKRMKKEQSNQKKEKVNKNQEEKEEQAQENKQYSQSQSNQQFEEKIEQSSKIPQVNQKGEKQNIV